MQMKKLFAVMMIALLTVMTMATGQVANAAATDEKTGSLTIHKFEQEPGEIDTGVGGDGSEGQIAPGTALPGVEYTIKQTHAYNVSNDEWTPFDGQAFTKVTDSDGQIVLTGLDLGRYEITESDGPAHVNLNPDTFAVDIPMTSADGKTLNYNVHIYPKNETIRGAVKLLKQDGENDNAGLADAVFNLYYKSGDPVDGGQGLSTNAQGYIYVDGLAFGDYYFTEVSAPDGYVLQGGKFEFSITKSGTIDEAGESTGKVEKVKVTNYYKPDIVKEVDQPDANRGDTVTYKLTIDLPGDIKDYKSFVITDELDPRLSYVANSESGPAGFTFDASGQTLTWTATDFAALEGGQITITFDAKIADDAEGGTIGNTGSIDYENESGTTGDKETPPTVITLTDGGFGVVKVDAADKTKTLAGAEFKLTDENGNTIDATGKLITVNGVAHGGLLENLTTGADGKINIDGLNVGTYYLVETKAPTYTEDGVIKSYRLLTNPIQVEIKDGDTSANKTVMVENSKPGWTLPKTGGFGTTLFTAIGLLLMAGAIYIYSRKEKSVIQ